MSPPQATPEAHGGEGSAAEAGHHAWAEAPFTTNVGGEGTPRPAQAQARRRTRHTRTSIKGGPPQPDASGSEALRPRTTSGATGADVGEDATRKGHKPVPPERVGTPYNVCLGRRPLYRMSIIRASHMAGPRIDQKEIRQNIGTQGPGLNHIPRVRHSIFAASGGSGRDVQSRPRGKDRSRTHGMSSKSEPRAPTLGRNSAFSTFGPAMCGPHARHPTDIPLSYSPPRTLPTSTTECWQPSAPSRDSSSQSQTPAPNVGASTRVAFF